MSSVVHVVDRHVGTAELVGMVGPRMSLADAILQV